MRSNSSIIYQGLGMTTPLIEASANPVFSSRNVDYITSGIRRSSDRTSVGGSDFTVTKSCKRIKKPTYGQSGVDL